MGAAMSTPRRDPWPNADKGLPPPGRTEPSGPIVSMFTRVWIA